MDTAEIAFQALLLADWAQTRQIAKAPERYKELNPLLGEHPSTRSVGVYFALMGVGHYVVTQTLPKEWRSTWQAVTITLQVGAVVHNYQIGLKIDF